MANIGYRGEYCIDSFEVCTSLSIYLVVETNKFYSFSEVQYYSLHAVPWTENCGKR